MNGADQEPKPAPVLALQALVAFGLLSISSVVLWDVGLRNGWIDDSTVVGKREGGAAVFSVCCLLVIGFACLVRSPLRLRPAAVGQVLAVYVPFAACWFLFVVGYLRLMHLLGWTVDPQDFLYYFQDGDPRRPGYWLMVAMTVLLAPLAEELVFRGYLMVALAAMFGGPVALVVTAVLFGLVHGSGYAVPIAVLGLLFGWLRQRHGSLLAPFVAHAVHNGAIVVLTSTVPGFLDWLYPR